MPRGKASSSDDGGRVEIPADLSGLTDEDLSALADSAKQEFDTLYDADDIDADGLARMQELADASESVQALQAQRIADQENRLAERDALHARMHPADSADGGESSDEGTDDDADSVGAAPVAEPVAASARPRTDVRDVIKPKNAALNARLSDARKFAPKQSQPTGTVAESILVASADIPGFTQGGKIPDMNSLVKAFQARSRSLPDQRGQGNQIPVASIQRNFRHTIDDRTSLDDVWNIMQEATREEALVAAGGWCSPSTIRYDFYNIADACNLVDLPTVGITRGGMRWPTSPSFGDLASSLGLWTWNETQDVAAATGTGQSGTKTCARVPCAAFNEARLQCEGVCITAGNFTTDAWPEQLANFLRLVDVAHQRRINSYFINRMVALSTAVSACATGQGSIVPTLDVVEMQAIDLRTKYSMCDGAILEAVFPSWALGVFRADIAKAKPGGAPGQNFDITNEEVAQWFTRRGIRVQWVEDYQVRASGLFGQSTAITAWPASLQFMLYPAGTFLRGNGLNLDLGVIRDSTLNATNDYTAAWSEECFLLAMIGHESRAVTVPICPSGARAADVSLNCLNC